MSTENLTKEERLGLNDGAVVQWWRGDGTWNLGTVDKVGDDVVWLYDGGAIGHSIPMRLVSALPAIPTDCDVRGINNVGVRFPPAPAAKPAELPSDLAIDEAADSEAPEAPQPPKRNRRGDNKRQNAERWLHAVIAVQEAMYAGRDRTAAVCGVADLPEFSSIRLNVDTFCWWRARFVRDGKLPKPRKTMPKLSAMKKDEPYDEHTSVLVATLNKTSEELKAVKDHCDCVIKERDQAIADRCIAAANARGAIAERDRLRVTIRETLAELATEREALKSATDNLARDQAERDAAVKRADMAEQAMKDDLASNQHLRSLHAKARAELAALKANRAPSSARVSVTIEATPAEADAILAAIGGR